MSIAMHRRTVEIAQSKLLAADSVLLAPLEDTLSNCSSVVLIDFVVVGPAVPPLLYIQLEGHETVTFARFGGSQRRGAFRAVYPGKAHDEIEFAKLATGDHMALGGGRLTIHELDATNQLVPFSDYTLASFSFDVYATLTRSVRHT